MSRRDRQREWQRKSQRKNGTNYDCFANMAPGEHANILPHYGSPVNANTLPLEFTL